MDKSRNIECGQKRKYVKQEKGLQQEICLKLNCIPGCVAWIIDVHGRPVGFGRFKKNPMRGFPDILCCYHGKFMAIEVKLPGKKPTLEQSAFLECVSKASGLGFVASSWDDVRRWITWLSLQNERSDSISK